MRILVVSFIFSIITVAICDYISINKNRDANKNAQISPYWSQLEQHRQKGEEGGLTYEQIVNLDEKIKVLSEKNNEWHKKNINDFTKKTLTYLDLRNALLSDFRGNAFLYFLVLCSWLFALFFMSRYNERNYSKSYLAILIFPTAGWLLGLITGIAFVIVLLVLFSYLISRRWVSV